MSVPGRVESEIHAGKKYPDGPRLPQSASLRMRRGCRRGFGSFPNRTVAAAVCDDQQSVSVSSKGTSKGSTHRSSTLRRTPTVAGRPVPAGNLIVCVVVVEDRKTASSPSPMPEGPDGRIRAVEVGLATSDQAGVEGVSGSVDCPRSPAGGLRYRYGDGNRTGADEVPAQISSARSKSIRSGPRGGRSEIAAASARPYPAGSRPLR